MTKQKSYYDWELALRTKPLQRKKKKSIDEIINTLDIPHNEFKKFLKLWKSKNII